MQDGSIFMSVLRSSWCGKELTAFCRQTRNGRVSSEQRMGCVLMHWSRSKTRCSFVQVPFLCLSKALYFLAHNTHYLPTVSVCFPTLSVQLVTMEQTFFLCTQVSFLYKSHVYVLGPRICSVYFLKMA